MNLEQLVEQIEKDLTIDRSQLDIASLNTPTFINKYLKMLMQERLHLRDYTNRQLQLQRDKWVYYSGKADAEVYKKNPFDLKIMKADLDKFLDADEELNAAKMKVTIISEKVKYLEEVIKTLHNRGFQIKNAIDWQKLTTGPV